MRGKQAGEIKINNKHKEIKKTATVVSFSSVYPEKSYLSPLLLLGRHRKSFPNFLG
jgi:hypothetical protein